LDSCRKREQQGHRQIEESHAWVRLKPDATLE